MLISYACIIAITEKQGRLWISDQSVGRMKENIKPISDTLDGGGRAVTTYIIIGNPKTKIDVSVGRVRFQPGKDAKLWEVSHEWIGAGVTEAIEEQEGDPRIAQRS